MTEDTKKQVIEFYTLLLGSYGMHAKEFKATQTELALVTGVSVRTVVRYIDYLVELGLLKKLPPGYSKYQILMNLPENQI